MIGNLAHRALYLAMNASTQGDPYWNSVVALLKLDGANNSLLLKDTVPRPSAIAWTVTTGAAISTTKFKFSGSSFYFDGVNGSIQTASGLTDNVFAADFAVEGWANVDDLTQGRCFLDTRIVTGFTRAFALAVETNGKVYFYTALDDVIHDGTVAITAGTWFHWELSRSNGVIYLFVNGALSLTLANTTIFNTGRLMLGRSIDTSGFRWKGYIQEFKCTPYTAGHTTAFTPPTKIYAQADSSTSHLLHLSGASGSTTVVNSAIYLIPAWEPHLTGPKLSTAVSKFGISSASFTGSMCMLQAPSTQYTMGSGDFTWELFFRYNSLNAFQSLICNRVDGGSHADQITVGIEADGRVYVYSNAMLVETASGIAANTQAHIALSVKNNIGKLFINGTQVGANFTCPTLANTGISIGANIDLTESFNGYIDAVRITKGVSRYNANFSAPTKVYPTSLNGGDNLWGYVVQYITGNGVNGSTTITDETGRTGLTVSGVTAYSNTQSEYNGTSIYNGTSTGESAISGISVPNSADFNFGTGDFCIDWSQYWLSQATYATVFSYGYIDANGILAQTDTAGKINIYSGSASSIMAEPNAPPLNVWVKYRLERVNGVLTLYRNGVVSVSTAFTVAINSAKPWLWGTGFTGGAGYSSAAYFSQIRVTRAARDGRPYVPETSPFPNYGTTNVRKYWRYLIASGNGDNNISIAETVVRAASFTADNTVGATATASSQYSGSYSPDRTIDKNLGTRWAALGTNLLPYWLQITLPISKATNYITMQIGTDTGIQPTAPKDFTVQSSVDGVTWDNEWAVVDQIGWAPGETRTFVRP